MIRFKLGKRVCAFMLSTLLAMSCAVPAFASSGQLATVGWAETVSAFLMSCGVYPYNDDERAQFSEWSADSLTALYNQFVNEVDSGLVNVEQSVIDFLDAGKSIARLTSSLVRGVVSIASGRWSVLRAFATWIINKYDVEDNQSGVELGASFVAGFIPFPAAPYELTSAQEVQDYGLFIGHSILNNANCYFAAYSSVSAPFYFAYYKESFTHPAIGSGIRTFPIILSRSSFNYYVSMTFSSPSFEIYHPYSSSSVYYSTAGVPISTSTLVSGAPVYSSRADAIAAFAGSTPSFSGVTVNTTTVSVPDALPEGSNFGGLAVQGAGEGVTPEQLQDLIRDAVQDALKPSVNLVPVVVAPDVDVSASGDIKTDLEIGGQDVPMTASDYSAPNITGVFPFSIPWDLMKIYGVLNAPPVRPDFEANIYVPVLDVNVPFHIGVTDEAAETVDSTMSVWRSMLLVVMCVGTLFVIWKLKS